MKKFFRALPILLTIAVLAGGCKKSTVSTTFIIRPHITRTTIETVNGVETAVSTRTLATGVTAHAFYADTTEWKVASFEDARAGIITNRIDETITMEPVVTGAQDENGAISLGPLTRLRLMLVICYEDDPEKIYGWRNAQTAENLESITVIVTADPYQQTQYKNSQWAMINANPSEKPVVAPQEPEP